MKEKDYTLTPERERETIDRLLDVLHVIVSIGYDYDNARTADELKKVIDDLVEIASRAYSGESIYSDLNPIVEQAKKAFAATEERYD